jgi:hypothetical protein
MRTLQQFTIVAALALVMGASADAQTTPAPAPTAGGPSQITAEYAHFTSAGPGLGGKSWMDFIYARDFGPHVQFDVEYRLSPTSIGGQKQHYVGAGLSFMN